MACFKNAAEAKKAQLLDNALFRENPIEISPFRPRNHPKLAVDVALAMDAPDVLRSEFEESFQNVSLENDDDDDDGDDSEPEEDFVTPTGNGNEKIETEKEKGFRETENGFESDKEDFGKEKCLEPDFDAIAEIGQEKQVTEESDEEEEEVEERSQKKTETEPTTTSSIAKEEEVVHKEKFDHDSDFPIDCESMRLEFDKGRITYRGEGVLYNFRDITYMTDSKCEPSLLSIIKLFIGMIFVIFF